MNNVSQQKLRYELTSEVVNLLLKVLDKTQFGGVQSARNLLGVVDILQSPLNAEEIEKEQLETLKKKFEPEVEKKDKK